MLVAREAHYDAERRITHWTEAYTEIVFETLPTLPQGATLLNATVAISGKMSGSTIEIEALDLTNNEAFITSQILVYDTDIYTGSQNEYGCSHLNTNSSCKKAFPFSVEATFDLPSAVVQQWYDGDNQGIRLVRPHNGQCVAFGVDVEPERATSACAFGQTEMPQLFIYYQASTLGGSAIETAVPGHAEDFFGRTEHEYELAEPDVTWLAVAAKVLQNGAGDLAVADIPLNVKNNFDPDRPYVFEQNIQGESVNYFVIDRTQAQLGDPTNWVTLDGWPDNETAATYRLQRRTPALLNIPDPTPEGAYTAFALPDQSDALISLTPFNAPPEKNLFISMTVRSDIEADIRLFGERPGLGKNTPDNLGTMDDGMQATEIASADGWRVFNLEALTDELMDETWTLAFNLSGPCSLDEPNCHIVYIELVACPVGYSYSVRWDQCQPLIFPHSDVGSPSDVFVPATSFQDVGGVRIFSEGGFDLNPTAAEFGANYDFCTDDEFWGMPLLGLTSDPVPASVNEAPRRRLIAVQDGSVCVTADNRIEIVGGPDFGAITGPAVREPTTRPAELYDDAVDLYFGRHYPAFGDMGPDHGQMVQSNDNQFMFNPSDFTIEKIVPWKEADWPTVETSSWIMIDQRAAEGHDQGTISVVTNNATNYPLEATWQLAGNFANTGFDFTPTALTTPPNMEVASLIGRWHAPPILQYDFDWKTNPPRITRLDLTDATIHQPESMGSAHKPIQAVILRPGAQEHGGCTAENCLDLRQADDIKSPDWKMPDVDVGGPTGSVMMRSPGHLYVFSKDHPYADQASPLASMVNAPALDFNFKTFSGNVRTVREPCFDENDPDYNPDIPNPDVMVIKGKTNLALPALGDGNNGGPGLRGEFRICQTKLRQVQIEFKAFPPGIIVGPSGVVMKSIDGTVWVNPEAVRIEIGSTFQSVDGFTYKDGHVEMIIDTRGYFELGGGATMLGKFGLDGSLVVAWNPLDILQEASLSFSDWFEGYLRLHMWRGQGWGDPAPYPWLPDNNDFHFTGAIGAIFTIKEGRIGQFFGVTLPRNDIEISVEVSFGEFCVNEACTSYEWGVQGKLTILEFTIGAYVSRRGVKFFVGDKGKKLIDQAFSARSLTAVNAVPTAPISDLADGATLNFKNDTAGACPQDEGIADCTFTIEPNTGEVLITVAWTEGTLPTAILYTPDQIPISGLGLTPTIDPAFGPGVSVYQTNAGGEVRFTIDGSGAFYTIENPQPGDWTLTLDNLSPDLHYNVLFAANSVPPALTLNEFDDTQLTDMLNISWTVTPDDTEATVHLAYIPEADYLAFTAEVAAGAPISETARYLGGVPIASEIPATDLSYQWQPAALTSGSYYLVGRIDHDIHGSSYSFSPEPFSYTDDTPPAVPTGLFLESTRDGEGLIASWQRNTEADLTAYQLEYSSPSLDDPSGFITRRLRLPPSDLGTNHPTHEQTRLVGLLNGTESSVCVRAIDASGNASACSNAESGTPVHSRIPLSFVPTLDTLALQPDRALSADWTPGLSADGHLLSWGYGCNSFVGGPMADQGSSNLDVANVTDMTLTGLPPGTYRVAVRGYRWAQSLNVRNPPISEISRYSNVLTILLTDNVDQDGDFLPDDWAAHFGVFGAADDPDNDGLQNQFEKAYLTDPTNPDSDGDGFKDGKEAFAWFTNPCDPTDAPDLSSAPFLGVWPEFGSLRFEAVAGQADDHTRYIGVRNLGAGLLDWTASASHDWIQLSNTAGTNLTWEQDIQTIEVTVDATDLEPGYYEGSVTVYGDIGGPVFNAPQTVPVRLWVMRNQVIPGTVIEGYVFLDHNANGEEDIGENIRVGGVDINLVSAMGVTMVTDTSLPGSGLFTFSTVPYAPFELLAEHPLFTVTTPNPLPLALTPEDPLHMGIKIGVAHTDDLPANDADADGVPDEDEDVNGDGNLDNDDTDQDGIPDYRDVDDDGDRILTRDELSYGDTDEDGLPNYRDSDDDNDGVLTIIEGPGDSNADGIPDYLDKNIVGAGHLTISVYLPLVLNP